MLRSSISLAAVSLAAAAPCDIFDAAGNPCVAAYSLTRALYSSFNGPLYQVNRTSDGAVLNISTVSTGGFANAKSQDTFCGGANCVVQRIFDQSPRVNHLDIAPAGGAKRTGDLPVNATRHPITVSGQKVYAAYFESGMGYRIDDTSGMATGNDPQTTYMVTSGTHVNDGCCFDFGAMETNNREYIVRNKPLLE